MNTVVKSNKRKAAAAHIEVEKKRRCRINSGYKNLRHVLILPDSMPKAQVLDAAFCHIQQMQPERQEAKVINPIKKDVFMGAEAPLKNELQELANETKEPIIEEIPWNTEWDQWIELNV